ncbi:MAG: hypothetical protein K0M45_09605 [Candidatus Paracaedibacteraceae bacterium]|nr:hypothetical protein [Candidatus Paracaedibacteraceae bacterium]
MKKKLQEIAKLIPKEKIISVCLYAPSPGENFSLSSYIEKQLNRVGIQTTRNSIANEIAQKKSNTVHSKADSHHSIIYITTSEHIDHIQNSFPDSSIHRLIIFPTKENVPSFFKERKNCSLIIIEEHESYHDIILEILKNLLPQFNIEPIISDFQNTLHFPFDKNPFLLSDSLFPSILSPPQNESHKIGLLGFVADV